jgi:hypothetical protein
MARPALFANGCPRLDYAAHLEPAIAEQFPALVGRDPRRLSVAQLEALGHTKQPLLRVIRTTCIERCADNEAEVRRCGMHWCPFWPYRMASNPFHRQELTEARRLELSARARANRRPRSNGHASQLKRRKLSRKTPERPPGRRRRCCRRMSLSALMRGYLNPPQGRPPPGSNDLP